jgi:ribosomal protein S18 acetylase RimI-like enzyme
MADKFTYRSASLEDIPHLIELGVAAYGKYAPLLAPGHAAKLLGNMRSEQTWHGLVTGSHSFLCCDGGHIAGMAYLVPNGNPWDIFKSEWSYIRMVGVHADYEGNGIARRLMELCVAKARETKEQTVALHTSEFMDAARHIYESMGFAILQQIPNRLGKKYWLYTMEL